MLKRFPFFAILLLIVLSGGAILAQDCPIAIKDLLATAQTACADLAPGQACYGAGQVTLTPQANIKAVFAKSGDKLDLTAVQALDTGSTDPNSTDWGVVLIKTSAGLPDGAQPVTLVLFGGAQIINRVEAQTGPAVTLKMQNVAGYAINLRGSPGTKAPVVGTLEKKAEAVVDGRNATVDWFRVQLPSGPAWVNKSLVKVEGDPTTLPVIDSPYTAPLQAFRLTTLPNAACGAASSGLLVQGMNDQQTARLQVNGAELAFTRATLLVQAQPSAMLNTQIIDGKVTITANNVPLEAETGASVSVKLGGADGLQPTEGPQAVPSYSFAAVQGAPFDLLDNNPLTCIAGLETAETLPKVYSGPGTEYREIASLKTDIHYTVVGWAAGSDNQTWWKLSSGRSTVWIPQAEVRTLGTCDAVAQAETPPLVSSAAGDQAATFVPDGRSIWQANSGTDNVSGVCVQPPLALCAHLAAITKNADGTIAWRGQEPNPYVLRQTAPNTFSYNGRHALGTGSASLSLIFTSDSTWTLTYSSTFDNDPQCVHTFYYTATRNW